MDFISHIKIKYTIHKKIGTTSIRLNSKKFTYFI